MRKYTKDELLVLAKRYNNAKRSYLLVDPLQAKHLAVSPTAALEMMHTLGDMLREKYPSARLIIGFAETATAIGAAAATRLNDCFYIHTTREPMGVVGEDSWLYFSEEHSHAVEQKICTLRLAEYAAATDTVILLDDEISTGKTLINIVEQLRTVPEIKGKRIVAASVINRCSEENMARLAAAGIECECLLKLPEEDYTTAVEGFKVSGAERLTSEVCRAAEVLRVNGGEPRVGVNAAEYYAECRVRSLEVYERLSEALSEGGSVLVLGTEECMYPALILGHTLEQTGDFGEVRCHATTRSPIGVSAEEGYPITEGYSIRSFYGGDRATYIYNPARYDAAIVVTDGKNTAALDDIAAVLKKHGEPKIYLVEVESDAHIVQV